MTTLLAQVVAENQALYTYGPLGIICAFFMWRDVSRDRERAGHEKERAALMNELRGLGHRVDGLSKALLVTTAESEHASNYARQFAQEALAKIEVRAKADMERSN